MDRQANNQLVERSRRLFGDKSCWLQVAALPWREADNGVEIMLITSRDTGRWILPKGWPEKGEEFFQAAAREALEEAGVSGQIASSETGRYFYAKARSDGSGRPCEVLVYPLKVTDIAESWKERGLRTRQWMTPGEAATKVNEIDLAEVISAFGAQLGAAALVPDSR